MSENDSELMRQVRDGRTSVLATLFERHHVRLYRYCLRVTGNRPHGHRGEQPRDGEDGLHAPAARARHRYEVRLERETVVVVGKGGPDIRFKTFNGNVMVRKR